MPTSVSLRWYSSRRRTQSASETDGSHRAGHVRHRTTPVAHGRHRARRLTPRADRRLAQEPQSTAAAVVVVPQQRVKILPTGPLTLPRARATPRRRWRQDRRELTEHERGRPPTKVRSRQYRGTWCTDRDLERIDRYPAIARAAERNADDDRARPRGQRQQSDIQGRDSDRDRWGSHGARNPYRRRYA
jgi:RNase P protein component